MDTRDGTIRMMTEVDQMGEQERAYMWEMGHLPTETQKANRKVGRNDPCPCGSGRKFKKCHLFGGRKTGG